jgi:HD-GYP domain-containing protein (c-di-GMP phosphodiesterase class II)
MNNNSTNDQSINQPTILLIGRLSDFEPALRVRLNQFIIIEAQQLPEDYHRPELSAVLISPSAKLVSPLPLNQPNRRFFYISFNESVRADIYLASPFSIEQFENTLNVALDFNRTKLELISAGRKYGLVESERQKLSEIGVALSAEKNLDKLLSMVLEQGRQLGRCQGASLYLVEKNSQGDDELVFKLTQNSLIDFDFQEVRFPITNQSLAGFVANTGEILNIEDVYKLDSSFPFSFDKSFDIKMKYRTKELLVLPMKNHKQKIIGVLQFINTFGRIDVEGSIHSRSFADSGKDRAGEQSEVIDSINARDLPAANTGNNSSTKNVDSQRRLSRSSKGLGFSPSIEGLLAGLASQAAVAIDNSHLIENIQNLFEGFVSASVNAIESRDPVTSGHSFRVAELTTGLAEMLNKETAGVHRNLSFSVEKLKELRYASLLHDFGKVGVKENVLLKANKLHASRFDYLVLKIEWQKQLLEKRFYEQLIQSNEYSQHEKVALIAQLKTFDPKEPNRANNARASTSEIRDFLRQLRQLDEFKSVLMNANQPTVSQQKLSVDLHDMVNYKMDSDFPFELSLLSESDFLSLSIKKGSLTESERQEIQSHVVHTQAFLKRIPWTDELAGIPSIAGAHHEKLDGSGYPHGLKDSEIPIASKIMTIADVFDALTAQDRPYKRAVGLALALDILSDEAKKGKVDKNLLKTFIDSGIYHRVLP